MEWGATGYGDLSYQSGVMARGFQATSLHQRPSEDALGVQRDAPTKPLTTKVTSVTYPEMA
jgi:hypothetical protein